jgi:hypothetical protein
MKVCSFAEVLFNSFSREGINIENLAQQGLEIKLREELNNLQSSAYSYLQSFSNNLKKGIVVPLDYELINKFYELTDVKNELKYPDTDEKLLRFVKNEMWDLKTLIESRLIQLKIERETPLITVLSLRLDTLKKAIEQSESQAANIIIYHNNELLNSNKLSESEQDLILLMHQMYIDYKEKLTGTKIVQEIQLKTPENIQIKLIETIQLRIDVVKNCINRLKKIILTMNDFNQKLVLPVDISEIENLITDLTEETIKENILADLFKLKDEIIQVKLRFYEKRLNFLLIPELSLNDKYNYMSENRNKRESILRILNNTIDQLQSLLSTNPLKTDIITPVIDEYKLKIEYIKRS